MQTPKIPSPRNGWRYTSLPSPLENPKPEYAVESFKERQKIFIKLWFEHMFFGMYGFFASCFFLPNAHLHLLISFLQALKDKKVGMRAKSTQSDSYLTSQPGEKLQESDSIREVLHCRLDEKFMKCKTEVYQKHKILFNFSVKTNVKCE